ncbi:MAG: hypothetical protein LBQ28_00705 [Prevotellaceae bacterium]|jgi:Fic family protein|nr:hypothetical protein [Prevotellaceae bacterium]
MLNQITKNKIEKLHSLFVELTADKEQALKEIAMAEMPEMVYNSNAIENSTLTLEDTEKILYPSRQTRAKCMRRKIWRK